MKNNNSEELKEIELPKYISIKERLKCSNCKYYLSRNCERNLSIKCQFSCYRFYNRLVITKFTISLIVLISAIVFNFIHFISFWNSVLFISITTASIIFVDVISDVILKYISLGLENHRKQKYERTVEQIEEQNKIIRKKMLGISDEFEVFISDSKVIYSNLKTINKSICSIFESPSDVEERINKKFEEMLKELNSLNEKLSMFNYDDSTIVPIYNVYLPKLAENSNYLIELSKKDKLTENQKVEFSNLLEVFRKKLEDENSYLDHKLEDDFITKMEALNKDLLPEYNGGENS